MKHVLLLILIYLCCLTPIHAKARFMGLDEVAAVSDFIGVIEVTKSEKIGNPFDNDLPQKGYWRYCQENTFKLISTIKRSPVVKIDPEKVETLWAGKSFKCGNAYYKPGKYLVFLSSLGGGEWITNNHQLGGLRIENDEIKFGWYLKDKKRGEKVDLDTVKKAISGRLLTTPSFTVKAGIPAKSIYNKWRDAQEYQKIVLDIYQPPKKNWPEGLSYFLRGYMKLDKEEYQSIVVEGGKYSVDCQWKDGSLIIEKIY